MHTATQPAAPPAWLGLAIPGRMAIVIERYRHTGDGTVTERHFQSEPETCDLSLDELRAHIGAAKQLVPPEGSDVARSAEPPYDRAARLRFATALIAGLMPAIPTIHTTLRQQNFSNAEIADLWGELVEGAASTFTTTAAPSPGLPDWGRRHLEENAN